MLTLILRILWVCKVLFGLSPSIFLSTTMLQRYLNLPNATDPQFAEKVLEPLHDDDFISRMVNQWSETKAIFEKTKNWLAEGFNLRKFKSNSIESGEHIFNKFQEDLEYSATL